MNLNSFEIRFLRIVKPRVIKEIECMQDIDKIIYPGRNKKYAAYQKAAIINAFLYMAGETFFLSHDVHELKGLEDRFIDHCKKYSLILNL
jgi:hypothetical protein